MLGCFERADTRCTTGSASFTHYCVFEAFQKKKPVPKGPDYGIYYIVSCRNVYFCVGICTCVWFYTRIRHLGVCVCVPVEQKRRHRHRSTPRSRTHAHTYIGKNWFIVQRPIDPGEDVPRARVFTPLPRSVPPPYPT